MFIVDPDLLLRYSILLIYNSALIMVPATPATSGARVAKLRWESSEHDPCPGVRPAQTMHGILPWNVFCMSLECLKDETLLRTVSGLSRLFQTGTTFAVHAANTVIEPYNATIINRRVVGKAVMWFASLRIVQSTIESLVLLQCLCWQLFAANLQDLCR